MDLSTYIGKQVIITRTSGVLPAATVVKQGYSGALLRFSLTEQSYIDRSSITSVREVKDVR